VPGGAQYRRDESKDPGPFLHYEEINLISRQLGLELYPDFIVTSSEVGAPEPNPLFLLALERARINAPEAIYVGDQYRC
jgi:phosphoglycolate phosphatase-like HAD superfamily hydrolase